MTPLELKTALVTLGLSEWEFAKRISKSRQMVSNWTSPNKKWNIPDNIVKEYVQPELDRQAAMCETCLQLVEQQADKLGADPAVVHLPWYISDDELAEYHDDTRNASMANADSMRVWHVLQSLGYKAEFVRPADLGTGTNDVML